MAERLSAVEARIGSVRQLSAVITAMRGIAAVRSHEANGRLDGIRSYAATIGGAIAQALALMPERTVAGAATTGPEAQLVVALCAEQGFVGAFNGHVLDTAQQCIEQNGAARSDLIVVGSHGVSAAQERGMALAWWTPMVGHVDQLSHLANRLADQMFERLQSGAIAHVSIVHARPSLASGVSDAMAQQTLIPFDFERFPPANLAQPPIIHVSAPTLLAQLADEYVFAELCEALTLSYAAENEARMRAMVAARENVASKLEELTAHARMLRQEQITEEVIELAAGTKRRR